MIQKLINKEMIPTVDFLKIMDFFILPIFGPSITDEDLPVLQRLFSDSADFVVFYQDYIAKIEVPTNEIYSSVGYGILSRCIFSTKKNFGISFIPPEIRIYFGRPDLLAEVYESLYDYNKEIYLRNAYSWRDPEYEVFRNMDDRYIDFMYIPSLL